MSNEKLSGLELLRLAQLKVDIYPALVTRCDALRGACIALQIARNIDNGRALEAAMEEAHYAIEAYDKLEKP